MMESRNGNTGFSRRRFIGMTAGAALLLPGMSAILAACGTDAEGGGEGATALPTGGPSNPVTLPVSDDNPPIGPGLEPEAGPLVLYSFPDFFAPATVKSFEEAYGVEVQITNFGNYEEALRKLAAGDVQADLYFPPQEQLGKLVAAGLLQPLNDSYLPNRSNLWPELSPLVRPGGLLLGRQLGHHDGCRLALRHDRPRPRRLRERMVDALGPERGRAGRSHRPVPRSDGGRVLRDRRYRPEHIRPGAIEAAKNKLIELMTANEGRFTVGAYVDLPEGKFAISHAFNSDPIGGQFFLPKDVDPSVLQYVWPNGASSGTVGGHVGTDNFTVLKGAANPILAHEFINYAITPEQAMNFFAYIGVPVPQTTMTATSLVAEGLLPETLASAILEPSQLEGAAWLQTLPADVDAAYLDAWTEVQRA